MDAKSTRLSAICILMLAHSLSANVFYVNTKALDTQNESVQITPSTLNTLCACDTTRNACDINCCCDPNCKDVNALKSTYNFICRDTLGEVQETCYQKKYLWTINPGVGFTRLTERETDTNLCVRVSTDIYSTVIPVDGLSESSVKEANLPPVVAATVASKRTTVGFQLEEELFTLRRLTPNQLWLSLAAVLAPKPIRNSYLELRLNSDVSCLSLPVIQPLVHVIA